MEACATWAVEALISSEGAASANAWMVHPGLLPTLAVQMQSCNMELLRAACFTYSKLAIQVRRLTAFLMTAHRWSTAPAASWPVRATAPTQQTGRLDEEFAGLIVLTATGNAVWSRYGLLVFAAFELLRPPVLAGADHINIILDLTARACHGNQTKDLQCPCCKPTSQRQVC